MAETAPPVAAPASKKKPNRLLVEEATNDDNSVVALNTATMEELCVACRPPPLPASQPLIAADRSPCVTFTRARDLLAATSSAATP